MPLWIARSEPGNDARVAANCRPAPYKPGRSAFRGIPMTALRSLLVAGLVALLVSACGVRGPLEPAPGAEDEPRDPPFILDPLVD